MKYFQSSQDLFLIFQPQSTNGDGDIKAIATEVMYKLFAMLEMKYDFKLSKNGEMEVTK